MKRHPKIDKVQALKHLRRLASANTIQDFESVLEEMKGATVWQHEEFSHYVLRQWLPAKEVH